MNEEKLRQALNCDFWIHHTIGDKYDVININGSIDNGWLVAYYPLFGTYKKGQWVEHKEANVLLERNGVFKELPVRYIVKNN